MKSFLLTILSLLISPLLTWAQSDPEMATTFRSEGKIYVVITVIAIVFTGLALFLFRLDRRIQKLEKNQD